MSNETGSEGHARREEKRAQFAEGGAQAGGRGNSLKLLVLAGALLLGVAAYLFAGGGPGGAAPVAGSGKSLKDEGGAVSIPLGEVGEKASFHTYRTAAGKEVRFFVLKSSDGAYRAALDSCDVCFAAKKGYRQEGDDMVCNNCGNHFQSSKVNEVHGGCNPVALGREVAGGRLRIRTSDLERGASYF